MIGQGRLVRLPLDPRLADVPRKKLINHPNAYRFLAGDAVIYVGHHNTTGPVTFVFIFFNSGLGR